MYKSKLINTLATLSIRELKKFGDYVISPFFNKNGKVILLFEMLLSVAPNYTPQNVDRQRIFGKIFPKESFNEQKLRYVMADLNKLLEGFLTHQQLEKEFFFNDYMLLNAYADRNLDKYFYTILKTQKANLQKDKRKDNFYYLYQYLLETTDYQFSHYKNNHIKDTVRNDLLAHLMKNLDIYYTSNKLKYLCEVRNNNNVMATQQPASFLEKEMLHHLQQLAPPQEFLLEAPPTRIYYQILMTLIDADNEEHYEQFIQFLNQYASFFREEELYNIQVFMRNYCSRRYNSGDNSGDSSYLRKMFDLYKLLIKKKRLLLNNTLSQWDYKNIVSIALRFDEIDLAEEFIHEYKEYIIEEHRNNAFTFNLAIFYYYQKKYNKTITSLHEVQFTDPYYHVDTKQLLIRCYYELDEITPLFYIIDALKAFVSRNKHISKINKSIYLSNLKFIQKLARIKSSPKRNKLAMAQKLKVEIKESQLNDPFWLYTKIKELEQQESK